MIVYSTKDILKKAKQLADLENSDFISYNEELTLLNDAYARLYQTSINAGDLLYVKKMCLNNNDMNIENDLVRTICLPKDFYQLYSVKVKLLGTVSIPLDRKPKDMPDITRSYEIKNNEIKVYGRDISEVEIEYFPTPDTLFIKNDDIKLSSVFDGEPIGLNKTTLITRRGEVIKAFNVDSEEVIKSWRLTSESNPQDLKIKEVFVGDNGVIIYFDKGEKHYYADFEYDDPYGTEQIFEDDGKKVVFEDGCIFLETMNNEDIENLVYYDNGNKAVEISKTIFGTWIDKKLLTGGINWKVSLVKDNMIYLVSDEGYLQSYDIETKETKFLKRTRSQKVISVGDYNLNNGYGYLVKDAGRGYSIISAFEDTKLDYPNNIYFSLLSYMLAMAYKIKQNADISLLSVSYEEALNQYYDMFKRDANASLRINKII